MTIIQLKKYAICEEHIKYKSFYIIRVNTDCNFLRFKIIADFDTYEEAEKYIAHLYNN